MPRISPKLFFESLKLSRALPYLLPVCRSLDQAQLELGWIQKELPLRNHAEAIWKRSKYVPLQYILGNQPFGSLEILCQHGVLIPRNDTEEWCFELINALRNVNQPLNILDMCTGTGCIPLLISSELENIIAVGVDISKQAIKLAQKNYSHNKDQLLNEVEFMYGDLFDGELLNYTPMPRYDLVISNPPYIPGSEFSSRSGMERSVKLYEPRLALEGDVEVFESLISNCVVKSNCTGFIFELAGKRQVKYVSDKIKHLYNDWDVGYRIDSNGQYRNVLGWKSGSNMAVLASLCSGTL